MLKLIKSYTIKIIVLLVISFLLLLIRPIFSPSLENIPDAEAYAKMVEYFRGNVDFSELDKRFISRILIPFIASVFPGEPIFSLIVVNITFSLLSIFIFNRFLQYFKLNEKERILGTLIFIISGPTIIDGSLPLTDSAGIFFTILSLYLYSTLKSNFKKELIIGIVISIGILARESVIFIAPIIILWILMDDNYQWKLLLRIISFIGILPLIVLLLLKILIPTEYFWNIRLSLIDYNLEALFQPLTLATLAQLSLLLIIGIFGNYSKIIKMSKIIWKLFIGMGIYLIAVIYVFFSASLASRFFWILYIFIIPLFLISLNEFGNNFENVS